MTNAALRSDAIAKAEETILVLERDVLTRAFLADYLRSCGYRVLEARSAAEALTILQESSEPIRVVLGDAENGFKLSGWVKANRPKIKVILAANAERASQAAADLCEIGPHGKRPYDPQLLVQRIRSHLGKGAD
ncbi:MAG TPA: response regulator [Xanthobacteraceae bacterium]|jgi:DNA-binding response OmpR family regulator